MPHRLKLTVDLHFKLGKVNRSEPQTAKRTAHGDTVETEIPRVTKNQLSRNDSRRCQLDVPEDLKEFSVMIPHPPLLLGLIGTWLVVT